MDLIKTIAEFVLVRGRKSASGEVLVIDQHNLEQAITEGLQKYVEDAREQTTLQGLEHPKH